MKDGIMMGVRDSIMYKTYDKLILDEKKRISDIYLVAKDNMSLKKTEELKETLSDSEYKRLRMVFYTCSSYILESIFNILVENHLDHLVYIDHHAGHRSNEK